MNKTTNERASGNFFTRRYSIPAWGLILIVIVLILITWLLSQGSRFSASQGEVINNAQDCDFDSEQQVYKCSGQPGYTITVSSVPGDVTAALIPISDEEESTLRDLPKDGIGCVVSIAGNLVFRDKKDSSKLVTSFSAPIRLTLNYPKEDASIIQTDIKKLVETSANPKLTECLKAAAIPKVEAIVPIYLYTPSFDKSIRIWKPFQNFSIDASKNEMTIEFLYWGDQQVGGGTKP